MTTPTVEELTIAAVHDAFRSGAYTARELVQAYLDRIEAIDKSGPALNSIITVSSTVLEEADALDARMAETGDLVGPLHGVPIVVKDQVETAGMVTTFGSETGADYLPEGDATVITKLIEAGAIILGKTTMPDFATSWFSTSSKSGTTRNPYDLSRDPGGSSSGSAAAVAASLALVGIGEDTGGSILLPASFCNLVGIRVTPGLISRAGMSSLVVPQDTAGPMARSVKDAAIVLDVLVGFDDADLYTAAFAIANVPTPFALAAENTSVAGLRFGILRQAFGDAADPDGASVNSVMDSALSALESAGATLVEIEIPDLDYFVGYTSVYFTRSLEDMNAFLSSRPGLPESMQQIHADKAYHPKLDLLEGIATGPATAKDDPEYLDRILQQGEFQRRVIAQMAHNSIDALVFPDTKLPAPTTADVFSEKWTCLTYPTNTVIASQLHFPAMTIPAGFTAGGLPVGLELVTLPYHETELISMGAGVEAVTAARRAPSFDV